MTSVDAADGRLQAVAQRRVTGQHGDACRPAARERATARRVRQGQAPDRTLAGLQPHCERVFATGRSAASRAALLAVAGLAVGGRSEVVVLHVDEQGRPEEGERLAGEVASGLIALAVNARPEVRRARRGGVAAEIAAAAAPPGSDLVVLGSRGRSDLGRPAAGQRVRGTAEEIAGTALGYGADLIVMGSRRLPVLVELLIAAR